MRHIIAPAAAALIMCTAAPALGKGHDMPSDTAQMTGQANSDATDPDGTGARNLDARAKTDGEKGVDGQSFSDRRSDVKGSESGQKSGDITTPN